MEDVWQNPGAYLGIIFGLIATGCGLPVPEEVFIITAGAAASVGNLDPWAGLASCLIGALLGDSALYTIGYYFGHNLVKAHPRLAKLLHAESEAKMEQLINRHGLKVLFLARFMVGIRAPVYLSIGILRTSFRKFLLFDAVCATAVVGVFYGLAYLFGNNVNRWIRDSERIVTILVLICVAVALLVYWIRRKKFEAKAIGALGGDALGSDVPPVNDSPPSGDEQTPDAHRHVEQTS